MKIITATILCASLLTVAGCANNKIYGTVTPYDGGKYQAVSIGGNKTTVLKMANNDAKVTCAREGKTNFRVVDQDVKYNEPDDIDSGFKVLDALGKIAAKNQQRKDNSAYEATTIFSCRS